MSAGRQSDLRLIGRLLAYARPYAAHIVGIFLLSLLSAPIALLTPVPLKLAVDNVLGGLPLPWPLEGMAALFGSGVGGIVVVVGLVVLVAFLAQAQSLAHGLLRAYTAARLILDFRARLFRHVQRLSLTYHDTRGTTDAVYRIQYDAPSIQWIAIDGFIPLITAAVTLASMWIVTASIDLELAVVALVVAPMMVGLARVAKGRLRARSREVKELESSAMSVVQETLGALRVVKAFGQEEREQERYVQRSRAGVTAAIRLAVIEGSVGLLTGIATAIGTGAVLFVGVLHVRDGTLSLGALLLVMGYLSQLYGPLKTLSKGAAVLQSSLAGAERAFALLDENPDVPESRHPRRIARARGHIVFRDVSFAYPSDRLRLVLRGISLDVPPGTRVGISGPTGAGKSTLVSLLMRFHDPVRGSILLDGIDLRDLRVADLRSQFGVVLQEPVLFSTTIAENIAYARPEASEEDIVRAAKAANAHDFIMRLPRGYETVVGDRGMTLSGGERQRISIARAFLRDAPILILDEPTSSLDVKTETGVMDAIDRLMLGRTTFMIAHRLSTLERCEVRLELRDARLAPYLEDAPVAVMAPGAGLASRVRRVFATERPRV